VFGRSFAKISPSYARILGQPRVGGLPALELVGLGLGFAGRGACKEENEGGYEEQGKAEHEREEEERGKKESSGGFTREF